MARNFSGTPKEYMKLRCYTKNGRPFYIKHDTFIKGSLDDITKYDIGDCNLKRQQAKGKDRKTNESTNSQKLLDDNVLTRSKKKKRRLEDTSSEKRSEIQGYTEIREQVNQNKNKIKENNKDVKTRAESGKSTSYIFTEPVETDYSNKDEKKKQMVIIKSENDTKTEQGIIKNDESKVLNVPNQDEEGVEPLYESNNFAKEISKGKSVKSEGNII